jgi:trimethylamine--corrinoid protein Co-methyltransferase
MRRGKRAKTKMDRVSTRNGAYVVRQLPWAVLRNSYPPMEPLNSEQLEEIHLASMIVLEEHGIEVLSKAVRARFRAAGARVEENTQIVYVDRELILNLVENAPSTFSLTPRNPDRRIEIGSNQIHFGMVSGPPNVHDCINGRRPGNFADYERLVKLGQFFNVLHFFGNQSVAPVDLPANSRHLDTYRANLVLTDKVFSAIPIGRGRICDAVEMVARSRGMSLDELRSNPSMFGNININSPRKLDEAMSDGALALAEHGQAVIVTPFTLLGAMTPVTLAGGLVQQNAEALFGIAMIQLFFPGTPVVYGGFTSNVDMRSGAPAFGTPENAKANMAGGQLARRYRLPYRTSGCNASNSADAQAVYETQMSIWSALLGHGNLIYHAAGWLEGGLVASFEKVIIDIEILQHLTCLFSETQVNDGELALDAIKGVAPGGHFFGEPHTMTRYENAFYSPMLSDWQNSESWQESGAKDATQRATDLWQSVISDFEPPPLDPGRLESIDEYIALRKREIKSEDP